MFGFKKNNKFDYDKTIKKAEQNLVKAKGLSTSMMVESGRYIAFSQQILATKR